MSIYITGKGRRIALRQRRAKEADELSAMMAGALQRHMSRMYPAEKPDPDGIYRAERFVWFGSME